MASRTAVNIGTFPACLEALTGTPGSYFSIEDTARLMQGFVPERSFTKDRRVIDMRIDSVLMVCATPDRCYRQNTDFIEHTGGHGNLAGHGAGRVSQPPRHSRQPHLMVKEVMPRLNE